MSSEKKIIESVIASEEEFRRIEVNQEDFLWLKKNWKEFIKVLPKYFQDRLVLVEGDVDDENCRYLLISHLKSCDHER